MAELHIKLRGNILHILCETPEALVQSSTLLNLVRSLLNPEECSLLKQAYPQVYQLYVYNRVQGAPRPTWTAPVYLNRLERHLAQLVLESQDEADLKATQELLESYTGGDPKTLESYAEDGASGAIVLSNLSLARKGDPEAIAWYLSETLSALDVGVLVSIKAIPGTASLPKVAVTAEDHFTLGEGESALKSTPGEATIPRLWILCEATYSPDPALIARPTAERLRQLQLTQFKDAVLLLQVRGEAKPDWSLRIDLTPREEMLKEWARWGDRDAITQLINQALLPLGLGVTAELKETTLHLDCQPTSGSPWPEFPTWEVVAPLLATLLDDIAPQGIHRAMTFGHLGGTGAPDWVGCLELPAAEHEALADEPETLAAQGDLPAIAFLLTRRLNPDLDEHLATGGLRVQLLLRENLLHVMVDGPVAPQRRQVAPAVLQQLQQLAIEKIEGVRIYGRRSGQAEPIWSFGEDFTSRRRLVPRATPAFSASDSYVNELLVRSDGPLTDTDLEDGDRHLEGIAALSQWGQGLIQLTRQALTRSHLFTDHQETDLLQPTPSLPTQDGLRIALIWGAVGLLISLQLDWLMGQLLRPPATPGVAEATVVPETDVGAAVAIAEETQDQAMDDSLDDSEGASRSEDPEAAFPSEKNGFTNGEDSGFIKSANSEDSSSFIAAPDDRLGEGGGADSADLPTSPAQPIIATENLLAASPYPSFRSQQLDEKLALYHQRLQQSGPPDVLIVGSSRALRGVDPVALRQQLSSLGYEDVSVFNFGVNGATAQVVDLTIRRILKPEQLPKLVVWADGARAFNSGRVDITYNAITTSEGYRELLQGQIEAQTADADAAMAQEDMAMGGAGASLAASYQMMDTWLSDQLGGFSAVFRDRADMKTRLQQGLLTLVQPLASDQSLSEEPLDAVMPEGSVIDFDGFLALSIQFNPATYYQKHARVQGLYDGDYESFRLEGQQDEAFRELLSFTQAQEIPLVFINTPLTDEYLDDYRQESETAFLEYMLRISTTEGGFIFRDLGQRWVDRYDYFSDPSHLNRYGAYQVSNQIAQDPMIPWPKSVDD